ncbi:hypothetical protein [Rhodoblastus sp.]|uniref:hypothetical protein n=1 Tax=Rhodoblastus sp. TaxID=1962975 RepID=UPI0025DF1655|nr:hypothetical protein [Rhodoblastus sp.]
MARGICLMTDKNGDPYAVVVDYGNMIENQVDLDFYEAQGYQPPWQQLPRCGEQDSSLKHK